MESSLTLIALVIGILGLLAGMSLVRPEYRREELRQSGVVTLFAIGAVLIVYFLTRPLDAPFSPGQRLGYGALIGGLFSAMAGMLASHFSTDTSWRSTAGSAGLASLALIGGAGVLVLFPGYPQPAIAGFLISSIATGVIFRLAMPPSVRIEVYTLSAVALGSTMLLAIFRFDTASERFWWRAPLLALSAVIVGQFASAAAARDRTKLLLPAIITSTVTLLLMAIFAWRLFPNWALFSLSVAGIATFALIGWIVTSVPSSARAAAIAALAVIALCTLGFRMLGGFGIGMALIAAWAVILPLVAAGRVPEPDENPAPARTLVYAMFVGVAVLLYRLFLETYAEELRGIDLRSHYTLIMLCLGVLLPFVLMSYFPILSNRGASLRGMSAAMTGLFAAAAPLAIVMIWGMKPALGFIVGSVAAEIFIFFICLGAIEAKGDGFLESAVLVLTSQVSAVLLSHLVMPLSETPRVTRIIILSVALVIGLAWAGASSLLARRPVREG